MTTVEIDIEKIKSAITKVETLSSAVNTQRSIARYASPIALPTLHDDTLGKKSQWLTDHLEDLTTRRDLAILLDTEGTGSASYTVPTDSAENVKNMLGELLAERSETIFPESEEGFAQYSELLANYVDDPTVMSSFYEALGPEGALELLSRVGRDDQFSVVGQQAQQELLDNLKTGLETASHDAGFDSEEFAQGLVDQATRDPNDYFGNGVYNPSGALAFLLWDGEYSTEFLSTVVTGLDAYERGPGNGAGQDLWTYLPTGGADFSRFMPFEAGGAYGNLDVMSSAMSALANDPGLALEFFGSENAADGTSPLLEYYLQERGWDQDAMGGLTSALDAAATDPEHIADPDSPEGQAAALLASQSVHYISERDDIEELAERLSIWPNSGTSENLAHLMGTYMAGVDRGLDPGLQTDESGPGVITDRFGATNTPLFDYDSITKLGLLSVANDDGAATMRTLLDQHRAGSIYAAATAVANGDENGQAILDEVLRQDARREGLFENLVGDEIINDGKADDARRQAWVSLAGDALGAVPIPGVNQIPEGIMRNLTNAAITQTRRGGVSWISEQLSGATETAYDEANLSAGDRQQASNYAIAQILMAAGLGDPDYEPPTWDEYIANENGTERAQVWEELFSTENAMPYFNTGEWDDEYRKMFDRDYFQK